MKNEVLDIIFDKIVSPAITDQEKLEYLNMLDIPALDELDNDIILFYNTLAKKEVNSQRDLVIKKRIAVSRLINQVKNAKQAKINAQKLEKTASLREEKAKLTRQRKLAEAEKILYDYIMSGLDTDDFISEYGYARSKFNSHVKIVKEFNNSLYEKYLEYDERIKASYKAKLTELFARIVNNINNGVVIDEEKHITRKFTIVDFYYLYNISIEDLKRYDRKYEILNYQDKKTFSTFIGNNPVINYSVASFLQSKQIKAVNDVPREITLKEKLAIVFYLEEYNIPLTANTIGSALDLYIKNHLFLSIPEEQTLKLK